MLLGRFIAPNMRGSAKNGCTAGFGVHIIHPDASPRKSNLWRGALQWQLAIGGLRFIGELRLSPEPGYQGFGV